MKGSFDWENIPRIRKQKSRKAFPRHMADYSKQNLKTVYYYSNLNFKELATFIVKVSAPGWFRIKCNPKVTNGATNLWET